MTAPADLGDLIAPASVRRAGDEQFPILSMTMRGGLVDQDAKFKKRVASANTADYRVVRRGQLVVGFPIDEGVLAFQESYAEAIVSPAYQVWDLIGGEEVDRRYLEMFLRSPRAIKYYKAKLRGSTARRRSLPRDVFLEMPVPFPPIEEQRRIAAVLDAADALRAKRRQALAKLDTLTQAIFIDMFGDPMVNRFGFPTHPLGELALKFSDGPFGSNLKSSHYVEDGVRIVRLQNIGVGEFIDEDAAYISESHFESLSKHECLPGDVLVGTLGDPNLRACIQPDWLRRALNKADCVQIRVDGTRADTEWLVALLNCQGTEAKAQSLVKGQTRARISMGRLRQLVVPVPPVQQQQRFAEAMDEVRCQRSLQARSARQLDDSFASLQQRAFRGEL